MSLDYNSKRNAASLRELHCIIKQEKYILAGENDSLKKNNEELNSRIQCLYNYFDHSYGCCHDVISKFTNSIVQTNHLKKIQNDNIKRITHNLKDNKDCEVIPLNYKNSFNSSHESISTFKDQSRLRKSGLQIEDQVESDQKYFPLKKDEIVTEVDLQNITPTYIDIFDDKEKANIHTANERLKDIGTKTSSTNAESLNLSYKKSISPIYVEIPPSKWHKSTCTKQLENISINDANVKQLVNTNGSSDENSVLVNNLPEGTKKMSLEKYQIIELLLKNNLLLEQMQLYNGTKVRYDNHCKSKGYQTTLSEFTENHVKEFKTLSCQTETILTDLNEIKAPLLKDGEDISKILFDQSVKIKKLSKKIFEIQSDKVNFHPIPFTDSLKSTNAFMKMNESADNLRDIDEKNQIKSVTSLEDISNMTDIVNSNSEEAMETLIGKLSESKSLSSLMLSTSESQYTEGNIVIENVIEPIIDNFQKESLSEINISLQAEKCENKSYTGHPDKFISKIPKLISNQSLDLTESRKSNENIKLYSNDLESSYETLYDPVLSSRYENEHTISI